MFQSTFSACRNNEASENAALSTAPPPHEVDAMWTEAMLHPIVYMDSEIGSSVDTTPPLHEGDAMWPADMINPIEFEIGSSVDTVWAELCDEEGVGGNDSHIDEQVSLHF